MTSIHMDTDSVRQIAKMLDLKAGELFSKADDIRRLTRRLSSTWAGGLRSSHYLSSLEGWINQCESRANELQTLSIRVNREVDEWQEVDSSGQKTYREIGDTNFGIFSGFGTLFHLIRGNIDPFDLTETWNFLQNSPTGKQLEELAKNAGVCFVFPDGTRVGDPNGKEVFISFDETDDDTLGYYSGDKIVIDNTLDWSNKGVDTMSAILAHEMQHAIDNQTGLLQGYDGYSEISDPDLLETFLEKQTETRISSEVRAFERIDNVLQGTTYSDDGILSASERRNILINQGYENVYESQLNDMLFPRYTVDVTINAQGELEITLKAISDLITSNYA